MKLTLCLDRGRISIEVIHLKSKKYSKHIVILFFFMLQLHILQAQLKLAPNTYLISFTDRNNNSFEVTKPEKFLSPRSLLRRQRQNISIKLDDLPVSSFYMDSLRRMGFTIANSSKWHNAVSVNVADTSLFDKLTNVSFVIPSTTYKSLRSVESKRKKTDDTSYQVKSLPIDFYGLSHDQIAIHNGDYLHTHGYRGQGMLIAVLDAGFNNANNMSTLDSLWIENRVKLMRDTYDPNGNVFTEDSHGSMVLSTMAADIPGSMVGTAPKADYLLLRSENATTETNGNQFEYLIEEFNWSVAAELADSMGADIISTSLGYTQFNDPLMNHTYQDMNGHTTLISKSAAKASSKGMIVVVSAGNEGSDPWHYISAPADADSILTVGAIDIKGTIAEFSSVGPTFDNRIKPDVMAVGYKTTIETPGNAIVQGYGTSFSAPIISGLVACLWQANPDKSNIEIINAIKQSSSQYASPDNLKGYGIPDFKEAYLNLNPIVRLNNQCIIACPSRIIAWPCPFAKVLNIAFGPIMEDHVTLAIFDLTGRKILEKIVKDNKNEANVIILSDLSSFSKGMYIVRMSTGKETIECKAIKL